VERQLRGLAQLLGTIDWRTHGAKLARGDLDELPAEMVREIDKAAHARAILRMARHIGVSARAFIIGLIARADAVRDRYADRVARTILGKAKDSDLDRFAEWLRLDQGVT
jgi:hypothetical protein